MALLALNVLAFTLPAETGVEEFRYEPPHPVLLQRLLAPAQHADAIVSNDLLAGTSTRDTSLFTTSPAVTARTRRAYVYRPAAAMALSDFELVDAPPGLRIDPATGVIAGVPTHTGRYDVVVRARLSGDTWVEHRYPLYVDDRYLLLGADGRGADLLRRIVASAKYSLYPGAIAALIGVGGGLLLGAQGGFRGGRAERAVRALASAVEAVPGLLLVFLAAVISGFRLPAIMVVVGLILLPETARSVMQRVAAMRECDFVEAARELGMPDRTILWREIVWHNARALVLARTTQAFVFAVLAEVTLGYMGLGVQDGTSLGAALLEGRTVMSGSGIRWVAAASLASVLLLLSGFSTVQRGVLTSWGRPT
jgi:peptide/nickel transport system permease protein